MCGIAGFYNYKVNYLEHEEYWKTCLEQMRRVLAHRGNDSHGIFLDKNVGLAHSRLSIRDIICGNQPMTRKMDGQVYTIVYNGEIYNTDELIPELSKNGYIFETSSDTEVILYGYMHYGPEFVNRLNGIFAFAIWDGRLKQLLLYRDRVGVKPLFYTIQNSTLLFGSEPKACFEHPDFTPAIEKQGLQELLSIGPAHTSGHGIFKGLKEVLPGHFLTISHSGITDDTYWDLQSFEHHDSYEDTVAHTRFLVEDAITRQLVSDVPVCSFLSGGIDSSIVTAISYKYLKKKGQILNTFSFDFKENDVYFKSNSFQPERDVPYVKKMLTWYHTNHNYLECDESTLYHALFTAVDAKDLPGMTDVDSSLLYFCHLVSKHNKVALTGECADEIFGGYPWFYRQDLLDKNGFPWSSDVTPRTTFMNPDAVRDLDLAAYSQMRYEESKSHAPLLPDESKKEQSRRVIGYLNIKWFMQTLLDRMDRTSMYSGLEARVPFADHRIIEYVFNVPWHMKYQNGTEKALLRDSCKDLLPADLLHRKKSPYPKTYHPGYEALLIKGMQEIINNSNAPVLPLLDKSKTLQFLQAPAEYGKPWFGQLMAGPQLMAYFIQLNYWMEKYHITI